jgi:hypothetical protein
VALAMTAPPHRHDEWRPHPGVERRSRWRLRRHHLPSDTVDSPVRRGFWHFWPRSLVRHFRIVNQMVRRAVGRAGRMHSADNGDLGWAPWSNTSGHGLRFV